LANLDSIIDLNNQMYHKLAFKNAKKVTILHMLPKLLEKLQSVVYFLLVELQNLIMWSAKLRASTGMHFTCTQWRTRARVYISVVTIEEKSEKWVLGRVYISRLILFTYFSIILIDLHSFRKMPLLAGSGGRFAPSKIDQRIKKGGEVLDVNVTQLPDEVEFSLGGTDLVFRDGQWSGLGCSDGKQKQKHLFKKCKQ
jgi:hypothetical protein